ncbi:MAG: ATP-binding cassette domain-containing protein [Candidatus Phytoplasma sp.]|nr:ATP-binding cassette domain-containing protein [Phytoplasma sp.]
MWWTVCDWEGITRDEVKEACKKLGLHHFIRTLPNSYETVLTEKASLSEGQKQIVTIARAMIKNAPLLILDEATSSVDTRTELIVQKAMDQLMEGRTSFIIAHRLSTIKNADLILVMKNGDIIEKGNHEELLKINGFYAELYNSQFEDVS